MSDSSKKLDDRQIKGTWRCRQSRFLFPDLSRKDRSDSASRVLLSNCLNWTIYCYDHSSLSSTTAVQKRIISYTSHQLPVCWMVMESWVVYATNVCGRDGDILLRTNTLEDALHTRVPLLLETKLTSILPPYMLGVWGSSLKFAFLLLMSRLLYIMLLLPH